MDEDPVAVVHCTQHSKTLPQGYFYCSMLDQICGTMGHCYVKVHTRTF